MQRVLIESVEETVYRFLESQKTYSSKRITIHVRGVEGRKLIDATITLKQTGRRPGGTITAAEAELRANPDKGELTIHLFNAKGDFDGFWNVWWPGSSPPWVIPLGDFSDNGSATPRPSETPLWAIPGAVERQQATIAALENQCAAMAAHQLMTGDLRVLLDEDGNRQQARLAGARGVLHRLETEPHRRWADGFSCLCFAMVGAPMAIRRRHGEFLASFFACFLPILLVYYPFLMVSVDQAKQGALPPLSVWLGNVVCVTWGAWLLRRVLRY
jgi:lipopolysaccharide export system permease protein